MKTRLRHVNHLSSLPLGPSSLFNAFREPEMENLDRFTGIAAADRRNYSSCLPRRDSSRTLPWYGETRLLGNHQCGGTNGSRGILVRTGGSQALRRPPSHDQGGSRPPRIGEASACVQAGRRLAGRLLWRNCRELSVLFRLSPRLRVLSEASSSP